jgi:hypothetical protein
VIPLDGTECNTFYLLILNSTPSFSLSLVCCGNMLK